MREKETASFVLDIEEDHGQLFETWSLDCIVLLAAASALICHQDIGDVLNAEGCKVVVAINQLQVLRHSQWGLAKVDAAFQHVFDMIILAILREARPQDIGGKLTLMVNSREEISQDPYVTAVLLAAFFNQLNQRYQITVLRKQALKGQQELAECLNQVALLATLLGWNVALYFIER